MIKTYGDWLNNWYTVYKKPYIKNYKTLQRYIELYIPKSIKKLPLTKFDVLAVQRCINSIPLSRTRVEIFDIFHGSLHMAYKVCVTEKDFSNFLIKPKHKRVVGSALSESELNDFLQKIKGHRYEYYFLFCLFTGSRRSEALTVTLSDIDFTDCLIHVKGTKTELSDRYVPLFPVLNAPLSRYIEKTHKTPYDRLFPFSKRRVTEEFKKLCPTHKLHDLRHTFATHCLECGINLKIVQRWLGHARLDTTANIYTHLQPEFVKRESEKFNFNPF